MPELNQGIRVPRASARAPNTHLYFSFFSFFSFLVSARCSVSGQNISRSSICTIHCIEFVFVWFRETFICAWTKALRCEAEENNELFARECFSWNNLLSKSNNGGSRRMQHVSRTHFNALQQCVYKIILSPRHGSRWVCVLCARIWIQFARAQKRWTHTARLCLTSYTPVWISIETHKSFLLFSSQRCWAAVEMKTNALSVSEYIYVYDFKVRIFFLRFVLLLWKGIR